MDTATPVREIFQKSLHPSRDRSFTVEGDGLAVIREEQASPDQSRNASTHKLDQSIFMHCEDITCDVTYGPEDVEHILAKQEAQLRAQFDMELKAELNAMRQRFDFILENEQIRTCCMLREAQRERNEKVQALQTQLECKNMTALMYVMCSERRRSKFEKMKIIEEYTKYIHMLQDILTEGQRLILHLSRGHKTAARVDQEWRQKMRSIIKEFQEYVYHYAGGTPESNQYVFDVPALLKTEASIVDDPDEDPCTCEEQSSDDDDDDEDMPLREKSWWERLDSECRPFVTFGDMADFMPPKRRKVAATVKAAAKTAPPKWKEYVFNEISIKAECCNAPVIKDEYPRRVPTTKWVCQAQGMRRNNSSDSSVRSLRLHSRRETTNSIETRPMGSILKIVTSSNLHAGAAPPMKTNLLAARDSMEIASATRLRERKHDNHNGNTSKNVSICIARSRSTSRHFTEEVDNTFKKQVAEVFVDKDKEKQKLAEDPSRIEGLGSSHRDSLEVIPNHRPEPDHNINYEKVCPMEQCQRMQMDSFIRALPAYMRASPYTLFEQNYTNYETCTPEQLEILKERLERKNKAVDKESVASDFEAEVDGIGVQTSELFDGLPPCTCRDNSSTASDIRVFRVTDLLPMKEALDEITKECFHNDNINFDRFKVIGQPDIPCHKYRPTVNKANEEFKKQRQEEIKNILLKHPSMLDLFQPNARC